MTNIYYPHSQTVCHHTYNRGGCYFCGFRLQKRSLSKEPVTDKEQIKHFNRFVTDKKNREDIEKKGRLVIAPNGSWFVQVPFKLREQVYEFIEKKGVPLLQYETRATLFNDVKAAKEFEIMYSGLIRTEAVPEMANKSLMYLVESRQEIDKNHVVAFGLEVANNRDLRKLNKGCELDDYIHAANHIHGRGARACANILLKPPRILRAERKALQTAKYAAEVLKVEEILIQPCIPMLGTPAIEDWREGKWNPISPSAASQIYREIKEKYPNIIYQYIDLGTRNFSGRKGKFKRDHLWTDEEKNKERERVKRIARRVFKK